MPHLLDQGQPGETGGFFATKGANLTRSNGSGVQVGDGEGHAAVTGRFDADVSGAPHRFDAVSGSPHRFDAGMSTTEVLTRYQLETVGEAMMEGFSGEGGLSDEGGEAPGHAHHQADGSL
jgi:hypothetical protein